MAEMAFSWTPYRFGFNNPLLYSDEDGRYERKGVARRARRRAKRLGYSVGEIYEIQTGKYGTEYAFQYGEGTTSISNRFHSGGNGIHRSWIGFLSFFSDKPGRGGIELHTGSSDGRGYMVDPEGTSFVIIDEILVPFGGGFTRLGKDNIGDFAQEADFLTNTASHLQAWESAHAREFFYEFIEDISPYLPKEYDPPFIDITVTYEKHDLPYLLKYQKRIVWNRGVPVDTLPSEASVRRKRRSIREAERALNPKADCLGCYD